MWDKLALTRTSRLRRIFLQFFYFLFYCWSCLNLIKFLLRLARLLKWRLWNMRLLLTFSLRQVSLHRVSDLLFIWRLVRKSLGLLLGSFLCWNRRVLLQLLNCVVNPFVLRFWHWTKSLIAIKCLLDVLTYVIFYVFIKPMSRRFGVLSVFVRWLTSFRCTWRSVIITLLGSQTTAISEMPAFTSFLNDKTFSIFSLALIIVKNHLLKLIKLKCLHKPLLLLLKIKLFLGIWAV